MSVIGSMALGRCSSDLVWAFVVRVSSAIGFSTTAAKDDGHYTAPCEFNMVYTTGGGLKTML